MELHPRHHVFIIIAVSIICMITCGSAYSISAWTPQLKANLNCTQAEIELVGTIGNLGGYIGPLGGVLVHVLPEIWVAFVCLCASILGLLPMSLAIKNTSEFFAHFRSGTALGLLWALQAFSSGTLYTMLVTVNLGNVPVHRRGTMVAALATLFGLSASFYTLVYQYQLDSNVGNFILFLMIVCGCAAIFSGLVVRRVDPVKSWAVAEPLDELLLGDPNEIGLVHEQHPALLLSDMPSVSHEGSLHGYGDTNDTYEQDKIDDERIRRWEENQFAIQKRVCGGGYTGQVFGSLVALVKSPAAWFITFIFFLEAGVGLMLINNVGHIVQSLNGGHQAKEWTTKLILILSAANGCGRLLMGLSDYTRLRRGYWLSLSCGLMCVTHFLSAFVFDQKEHVLYMVIGGGVAYGALWSIMPIIVSDNFGAKNFSLNMGWVGIVPGLGGLLFNTAVGYFYDQHTPAGSNECVGTDCYKYSFILCGSGAGLACLISLLLAPSTRRGARKVQQVAAH